MPALGNRINMIIKRKLRVEGDAKINTGWDFFKIFTVYFIAEKYRPRASRESDDFTFIHIKIKLVAGAPNTQTNNICSQGICLQGMYTMYGRQDWLQAMLIFLFLFVWLRLAKKVQEIKLIKATADSKDLSWIVFINTKMCQVKRNP